MEIIKTFEALVAVVFLWVSVNAFVYGCIEQSTFWIAIAIYIYCKLSSYITAYELGWFSKTLDDKEEDEGLISSNEKKDNTEEYAEGLQQAR